MNKPVLVRNYQKNQIVIFYEDVLKIFNEKNTKTFQNEVIAGTTTFLTMVYIMFNSFILSGEFAGSDKGFFDFMQYILQQF